VVVGWQQGTVDDVFQVVVGHEFHVGGVHPLPCECRITCGVSNVVVVV
jgi:hypothetical protein